MKKIMKGTKVKEDCYIISDKERIELIGYRNKIKLFNEMYSDYVKTYKY